MDTLYLLVAAVVVVGAGVWFFLSRRTGQQTVAQARREAERLVADAERESKTKLREAEVAAKEKLLQARSEFEAVGDERMAAWALSRLGSCYLLSDDLPGAISYFEQALAVQPDATKVRAKLEEARRLKQLYGP